MIRFDNVTKRYDGTAVVSDFDLEINEGEFFVLIGPSGSGKTTTLKMINKLILLSEGYLYIDGEKISEYDIQELRWNIGYVLQQIALFPNMTVEENITIVPEMLKWSKEDMRNRVTELLESVNLDPDKYRGRQISELSGGEQQRVGVVRALAANPDIILMDEPFGALDPITRNSLQQDVLKLQRKFKKTVVFVTHDMQEAIQLGDRICVMNKGKIEQVGTADEILKHPANDFVKDFLRTGLPYYEGEKTVQTFIDKGFCTNKETPFEETVKLDTSLDDLTLALARSGAVKVETAADSESLYIKREHLIHYYADDILAEEKSKKEVNA
ncbi:osmoprotectant transport system ATP-binding protein [Alkalibacterium putridalgicola]|uniref:ABC-type quaternary amine transporter n=1 Tax=Alkalibacterium putridalgicola TaxID=426703 RepID=A0A1H7XND5_9LACT|nr:ABC transporter ATP-binding protein [Alkalibacterium putridalgicola]GEK90326.1 glycine/betaine ABC transporter ATP-binding protein [Alkalibacterium putridalgicola]SEM35251.1 osmoprotectant transport system ATP-binding protein [Alkalibacterium putridalgicola]